MTTIAFFLLGALAPQVADAGADAGTDAGPGSSTDAAGASWDGPLLLVEAGVALWPNGPDCTAHSTGRLRDRGLPVDQAVHRKLGLEAPKLMGANPWVVVSDQAEPKPLAAWNAICLVGECGSNQLAFAIESPSTTGFAGLPLGVVIPRAVVGKDRLLPLSEGADCSGPPAKEGKSARRCSSWETGDRSYRIEQECQEKTVASGEGEMVQCSHQRWRLEAREGGHWKPMAWLSSADNQAGRDDPLALLLAADGGYRVAWYSGEGICCADASSVKMVRGTGATEKVDVGRSFPAGSGQPCD